MYIPIYFIPPGTAAPGIWTKEGKIGEEELENIINKAWLIQEHAELIRFLQGFSEQLFFYTDTSWNVRSIG